MGHDLRHRAALSGAVLACVSIERSPSARRARSPDLHGTALSRRRSRPQRIQVATRWLSPYPLRIEGRGCVMAPADPRSHAALVLAVAAGDPAAADIFKGRHAALLEWICGSVTPDARSKANAYRELAASADLEAVFAGYDGRATWRTFVIAAVVGRFLFPRLLGRLRRDPAGHAHEFEGFFRDEIARAVRAFVKGRELREDAAQWVWEQLLDDECRQLKTFADEARTPAFVVVKLKRLAQDFLNSRAAPAEGRRRTLPDALAEAPAFDQAVYKQFYWWHAASAGIALLALRPRHPEATEAMVREARLRIEAILKAHGGSLVVDRRPINIYKTNEDGDETLVDVAISDPAVPFEEVERAAFRRAVFEAARDLTDREKLCLLKRLQGKAAGEIARDLGIANPEAYDLMRKVVDKLRRALSSHPAARERIATVTGDDAYVDVGRTAAAPARPSPRAPKGADR